MTNLILDQGATWRRGFYVYDDAGLLVNLTGATARLQGRIGGPDGQVVVDLDSAAKGGLTLGGTSGSLWTLVTAATSTGYALTANATNQGTVGEVYSDGTTRTATGFLLTWGCEIDLANGDTIKPRDLDGAMVITRDGVR